MGELPAATLADEIETPGEGQIRALFTVAGNPVLSAPEGERMDRALASLDFMVSVDIYCNETTRHADVILPPPSALERIQYDLLFYQLAIRNISNYSPRLFEPSGPSEADILAKLALIVTGQGAEADPVAMHDLLARGLASSIERNEHSPAFGRTADEMLEAVADRQGPERVLDLLLRAGPYGDGFGAVPDGLSLAKLEATPHGVDLGPLAPRLPEPLATESNSVELLPEPIAQDLARLHAGLDVPRPELLLIGRRHLRSNNSWMHNIESLVRGKERCTLQIHPVDAERLELDDGALARVSSTAGELVASVEISESLRPGVVSLPHGWGHDSEGARLRVAARHAGVNSNRLTPAEPADPLSGNAGLNAIPVEITQAH
jgi:anaerobic selenocysteine-containing dehydrogenase